MAKSIYYSENVFSSIWQTFSEIFVHTNLSQNREIWPSGTSNPYLKSLSGLWSFAFRFQDISADAIPVQEKYITEL